MYAFWFWLHVACAWLSVSGFVLRGLWMLGDSPLRQSKPARVLPHVVDTFLLVSAAALAISLEQYPFADAWLTAKLVGLIVYIGLGLVAFRFARTRALRAGAFVAALGVAAYILLVAYARTPLPL